MFLTISTILFKGASYCKCFYDINYVLQWPLTSHNNAI